MQRPRSAAAAARPRPPRRTHARLAAPRHPQRPRRITRHCLRRRAADAALLPPGRRRRRGGARCCCTRRARASARLRRRHPGRGRARTAAHGASMTPRAFLPRGEGEWRTAGLLQVRARRRDTLASKLLLRVVLAGLELAPGPRARAPPGRVAAGGHEPIRPRPRTRPRSGRGHGRRPRQAPAARGDFCARACVELSRGNFCGRFFLAAIPVAGWLCCAVAGAPSPHGNP